MGRFRVATLAALMMLFVTAGAQAQVSLGIRGGANFSSFSGDDAEDAETKTGLLGGVFLQFSPSSLITIQPEALYTQMGASFNEAGDEFEIASTYVQIPVLARVNFGGEAGGLRPHFLLGPSVSFKVGCDYTDGEEDISCDNEALQAIGIPDVKSTDFGLVFGAGVGFGMGTGELSIDGRLYQGLSKVFESFEGEEVDVKNEAWQVTAGFAFPLGGRR